MCARPLSVFLRIRARVSLSVPLSLVSTHVCVCACMGICASQAVDLYVLERALESTHTQTHLMDKVLVGYKVI